MYIYKFQVRSKKNGKLSTASHRSSYENKRAHLAQAKDHLKKWYTNIEPIGYKVAK